MQNPEQASNWIPAFPPTSETGEVDSLSSFQSVSATTPGSSAVDLQSNDQFLSNTEQKSVVSNDVKNEKISVEAATTLAVFEEDARSSWSEEPKQTEFKETAIDDVSINSMSSQKSIIEKPCSDDALQESASSARSVTKKSEKDDITQDSESSQKSVKNTCLDDVSQDSVSSQKSVPKKPCNDDVLPDSVINVIQKHCLDEASHDSMSSHKSVTKKVCLDEISRDSMSSQKSVTKKVCLDDASRDSMSSQKSVTKKVCLDDASQDSMSSQKSVTKKVCLDDASQDSMSSQKSVTKKVCLDDASRDSMSSQKSVTKKVCLDDASRDSMSSQKSTTKKFCLDDASRDSISSQKSVTKKVSLDEPSQHSVSRQEIVSKKFSLDVTSQDSVNSHKSVIKNISLDEASQDSMSSKKSASKKLFFDEASQDSVCSQKSVTKKLSLDEVSQDSVSSRKSITKKLSLDESSQGSVSSHKSVTKVPCLDEASQDSVSSRKSMSKKPCSDEVLQDSVSSQKSLLKNCLDEASQDSVGSQKSVTKISCTEENVGDESKREYPPENLFEYMWPQENGELYILQEQICDYLNVKSFKRKYPDLMRRAVDMGEKNFLREKGVVSEMQCDLGLTALRSEDILELMNKDYPDHYKEYIKVLRDREQQSIADKQKEFAAINSDKNKMLELVKKAVQSAADYNAHLNQERRDERKSCMDLQTFTIHYPVKTTNKVKKNTKPGKYPVALLPGQFQDYYKEYSPDELKYLPVNTVLYGPLKELNSIKALSDGSQSDSDDSTASDGSCSSSQGTHDDSSSSSEKTDTNKKTTVLSSPYQPKIKPNAICKVCKTGPEGKVKDGKLEELVHCSECDNSAHPSCIQLTMDVVNVLKTYPWQCMDCKVCSQCRDPNNEDKILFCDICDRGYHTFCVGLKNLPQGKWVCRQCGSCSFCGVNRPGPESSKAQWQYDTTKTYETDIKHIKPKLVCQLCYKKKR